MLIPHQAGDVDFLEGDLTGELKRHHDHAGDPEENDVEAGNQYVGWVKAIEKFPLIGPAQGGEGPQRRGKPGIQNIFILVQLNLVAESMAGAHVRFVVANIHLAIFIIPGRNPVSPP